MTSAFRIERFGGPEVMTFVPVEVGGPGAGQVRIEHEAIGVNMIDTYVRKGLYPVELPSGVGAEATGRIAAVGQGVHGLEPGQRVAYVAPAPFDAYSEARLVDASCVVALPDEIDAATAAAVMLKGLTCWFLLRRSFRVGNGDWLLIYAAAGGVGSLLVQWAADLGARVIGIVGSEEKREIAAARGCEAVMLASDDVVGRVRALTDGKGVAAVYDSIGRDTFMQSLDCLAPHGVMVSYGNASGPVDPVSPLELMRRGSLYLTRPSLFDFIAERGELEAGVREVFARVVSGALRVDINQRFALADAAEAHHALEGRRTTGATVLMP
ncbi:MAG TPA: quinone oxidoreductase [Gammaproteobacteria bacterium]|nr:quinone oxidoreductase [Gammaproteobacteria bacterium]